MTENLNSAPGNTGKKAFIINGQYVRDLSFENPQAPRSLIPSGNKPSIDLSVDLHAQRLQENSYELAMEISAKATTDDLTLFIAELTYAGLFTLVDVPEEDIEHLLLVECPQVLFPFARRVIADTTRDGGFPPLMLEPMDFRALYDARKAQIAQAEENAPEDALVS